MDAWLGLIGTAVGALIGAASSMLLTHQEEKRKPKLLVLEKRIEAHQLLYGSLYGLADCLHKKVPPQEFFRCAEQFKQDFLQHRFYLDAASVGALVAVHNYIQQARDQGELQLERFQQLLNPATSALIDGIGLSYA